MRFAAGAAITLGVCIGALGQPGTAAEDATLFLNVRVFDGKSATAGDPRVFARTIETTVHELNADLPLFDVTTLKPPSSSRV